MKEKIYTIPVTEAFAVECECPVCVLEKKIEDEYIDYFLGPSLMEPDCRIVTNENGFCRRHFEMLYNRQENRLGLGLVISTHLHEQLKKMKEAYNPEKDVKKVKRSGPRPYSRLLDFLSSSGEKCSICGKLDYTMDRYMDVIMYLWEREKDFRQIFESRKGFCLRHMKQLLEAADKYLRAQAAAQFTRILFGIQIDNLERIRGEVEWFTKKFDYRNNDAPWGNSKDALPRSIQKIAGFCDLK